MIMRLKVILLTIGIVAATAAISWGAWQQTKPAPNKVMNMGGPGLVDEFTFSNFMSLIEPGMVVFWASPFGDAYYLIKRLPPGNVITDEDAIMAMPDMKGGSSAKPRERSSEEMRDMLILKAEQNARLLELARKHPLPDGWPRDIGLWKTVVDPATGKLYLAPVDRFKRVGKLMLPDKPKTLLNRRR
jgi:hypothetical protein